MEQGTAVQLAGKATETSEKISESRWSEGALKTSLETQWELVLKALVKVAVSGFTSVQSDRGQGGHLQQPE